MSKQKEQKGKKLVEGFGYDNEAKTTDKHDSITVCIGLHTAEDSVTEEGEWAGWNELCERIWDIVQEEKYVSNVVHDAMSAAKSIVGEGGRAHSKGEVLMALAGFKAGEIVGAAEANLRSEAKEMAAEVEGTETPTEALAALARLIGKASEIRRRLDEQSGGAKRLKVSVNVDTDEGGDLPS